MLLVKKVSAETYARMLEKSTFRYFLNQMPEFGQLKELEGNPVDYLLFFSKEQCIGFAVVIYYSIKKVFYWGNCIFGPLCLKEHFGLVLKSLKKYVLSYPTVLSLRVNPLFADNLYQDVQIIEENVSEAEKNILSREGFSFYPKEWYEDGSIHLRCVYSKNIQNQTLEEILGSLDQTIKRKLKKSKELQVEVENLEKQDLDIFHYMFNAMADRKEGLEPLRNEQISIFYKTFKEKIFFPVAYIKAENFEKYFEKQLKKIELQKEKIENLIEKNGKTEALLKQLQENENQKYKLLAMQQVFSKILEEQKNKFNFFNTHQDDRIFLSAACFIASGQDFIFYMGGGPKELMDFQGTYAIHQNMLELAVQKACVFYNLYGCSDRLDETDANYGILKFKRQFKGNFEKYIGTYVYTRKFAKLLGF